MNTCSADEPFMSSSDCGTVQLPSLCVRMSVLLKVALMGIEAATRAYMAASSKGARLGNDYDLLGGRLFADAGEEKYCVSRACSSPSI